MPIAASPGLPCNSDSCAQKKDYSEFLCLLRGIHKIPHSYLLLKKELTISRCDRERARCEKCYFSGDVERQAMSKHVLVAANIKAWQYQSAKDCYLSNIPFWSLTACDTGGEISW